ncbi:hypothetical protein MKX03_032377 [Papaver bracteatum]|nr:hypothetical protein MKX03_032377 [Papaver bracteatum]
MVVYKSALSWCHSISLPVKHGKLNAYLLSSIIKHVLQVYVLHRGTVGCTIY